MIEIGFLVITIGFVDGTREGANGRINGGEGLDGEGVHSNVNVGIGRLAAIFYVRNGGDGLGLACAEINGTPGELNK